MYTVMISCSEAETAIPVIQCLIALPTLFLLYISISRRFEGSTPLNTDTFWAPPIRSVTRLNFPELSFSTALRLQRVSTTNRRYQKAARICRTREFASSASTSMTFIAIVWTRTPRTRWWVVESSAASDSVSVLFPSLRWPVKTFLYSWVRCRKVPSTDRLQLAALKTAIHQNLHTYWR